MKRKIGPITVNSPKSGTQKLRCASEMFSLHQPDSDWQASSERADERFTASHDQSRVQWLFCSIRTLLAGIVLLFCSSQLIIEHKWGKSVSEMKSFFQQSNSYSSLDQVEKGASSITWNAWKDVSCCTYVHTVDMFRSSEQGQERVSKTPVLVRQSHDDSEVSNWMTSLII